MKRAMMARFLLILMVVGLHSAFRVPPSAFGMGGGDAKKRYKEGQKLEAEGQFDHAADAYMMALGEDSTNIQYRIAYQRMASKASVTLVRRGRELMEQGKYEEAYNAFRRAFQFDQTNQLAKDLTTRALQMQRQAEGGAAAPVTQTPYGGRSPSSLTSGFLEPIPDQAQGTNDRGQGTKDKGQSLPEDDPTKKKETILLRNLDMKDIIKDLAGRLGLNVVFERGVTARKQDLEMRNVTVPQALDSVLMSNQLFFEPINENTLMIAPDNLQVRQRIQQQAVRTFYLKSADPQALQTTLTAVFQNRVTVFPNAEARALVVRGTTENLRLVEDLIAALDKDKPEVLVDVNIYEVSQQDMQEIGNQLLYDGFLGQNPSSNVGPTRSLNFLGVTAGQIISEQRLFLGIPTSILRMLQSRGNSKLIDSLQVHALHDKQVTANVGQRIPIQTASLPSGFGLVNQPGNTTQNQPPNNNNFLGGSFGLGYPQIEYQDVGLNISITPRVLNNEDIQLEMEIQTSGVLSGGNTLTPSFTNRNLKSMATVKSGQAAMMAGVAQRRNTVSRTSLPFIGFLPVIGRFFSIPQTRTDTIDLLITLTPHIIRGADIREEDKLAFKAGALQGGSETIEAYLERREQARRRPARPTEAAQTKEAEDRGSKIEDRKSAPPLAAAVLNPQSSILDPRSSTPGATLVSTTTSSALSLVPSLEKTGDKGQGTRDKGQGTTVPVSLEVYPGTPRPGDVVRVAVMAKGSQDVQGATLVLSFNSQVLKFKEATAGSLLSAGSAAATVTPRPDPSGSVLLSIAGNEQIGSKRAQGNLVVVTFEVVGAGETALQLDGTASQFVGANGTLIECAASPVTIKVQ